jgi:metal-responsive CopG/Arc/MetJ family transcriptional regulator
MNTQRINLALNSKLLPELKRIAKKGKMSEFINQAVKEKIDKLNKEVLDKELEEGYKAEAKAGLEITKEFETVDLEGWDEY